jgi:ribosomal protection tetracycline resistance protein
LLRRTLNLGILAHVDAGKTTLTERLLYAAGVIDELGSVDDGSTQTDTLALEQQRGITIKSAVVSFAIDDVTVNLIDTPGHPDFIAEVERVLSVLDGAVLVISGVEGVQPQTRILMRALQRLRVPTLLLVNKLDRAEADPDRVLCQVSAALTPWVVPMPLNAETAAPVLAEHDEALLALYLGDETIPDGRLRGELARQTQETLTNPVFFGSARTGSGVDTLMTGIAELLPAAERDADGPVSGSVFKIERGPSGGKIAFVRMFSGTVRMRDRVRFGRYGEGKVTAIAVFEDGPAVRRDSVSAGEIGKLWGLAEIQIGDAIGTARPGAGNQFPPPTFETVVVPRQPEDKGVLRLALAQLAEQDPLIDVRQDDSRQELSVSLYGEVQKEVIEATLATDYGLDVTFRETRPICVERPIRTGDAVEILHAETNPYRATIGLRVDPAPAGSGIEFRLGVDYRGVPLYVYKTLESFEEAMGQYVHDALRHGLFGWQVTDCVVTMTQSGYSVPDGPPSRRGPLSTAADFRKLTPLVLVQALERAGTVVCEPIVRVSLEVPTETVGAVLPALARLGGAVETPSLRGELSTIEAVLPAVRSRHLQQQLPELTHGEGVLESSFAGYAAVNGND